MMKFFSFLILLTACSHSQVRHAERPTLASINIIDRNGLSETINNPERLQQYSIVNFLTPQPYQKVLRIFSRDAYGNIPACITSYHSNGTPKQCLEVVNGRACGSYQEWHLNGTPKISAIVIEGSGDIVDGAELSWIFDEYCSVWDENGTLIASIPYVKGSQEGVAMYHHSNGNIWKIIPYQNDKMEGDVEIYRSDGVLLQRNRYRQGVLEGKSERYWDSDKLSTEELYCEGLLSFGRYYDQNGQCIAQIDDGNGTRVVFSKDRVCEEHEYHNGVLEGAVKVFDKSGSIIMLYHVKNACKHGDEIIFYDFKRLKQNMVPKLCVSWYEGKIQGIVKTWYDNGVQESQKEMSNNKKNGHSIAWYRDGSLMMIEEYDQDILVKGEYYSKDDKFPVSTVEEGTGLVTLFDAEGNFFCKIQYWQGKPQLEGV